MTGKKTEKPSPKRLRDLRKKGQVPHSKEVVTAAVTIGFFALFFGSLSGIVDRLKAMILKPIPFLEGDFLIVSRQLLEVYVSEVESVVAPFLGVVLVIGVGAYFLQNGVVFSPEAAAPSLKKLSPSQNIKRIFSLQNLADVGKSIVKLLMLGLVLVSVLNEGIDALVWTPSCGRSCLSAVTSNLLLKIAIYVGLSYISVAIVDFAFQRWQFTKKNMMSKDEVKQEFKESEGNPLTKGRRKRFHTQLLAKNMIDPSRRATVLVTNPTHIAVAIYYDRQHTPLPIIEAIGTDHLAQRMIDAAVAAGVPVLRNIRLARALLEDGLVDEYIPSHLIEPLAEVLRALGTLAADAGSPLR
ncbi:type III secretion system export apparatus subunit SctU [Sinorhizobium sp. 7-81]|uniref:type III secretion system export apparatus subunit SctU n=1 Tax=Sinorhizobium sp. 8-89 TaxID=3049089 RepID=UPI0024C3C632|nr:type III secretion system export apparatus subunit SctU [Sinorhizobium sp. 8-89]MDK1492988.1 type III secretion system export apparatus subunit SctU [Sinorhizobium sp. 8-89]